MLLARFDRAALPNTAWKNGGGQTCELVCQPLGADLQSFDWRVSIALIERDGDFSIFNGIDRNITLLSGAGFELQGADHCLDTPFVPYPFRGETPIRARLLGAASHDFNVMTRRAVCTAAVVVHQQGSVFQAPSEGLLFTARGQWQVNGESLSEGQGICWQVSQTLNLKPISSEARLISVAIWRKPIHEQS
jgi:uncharacterized protein